MSKARRRSPIYRDPISKTRWCVMDDRVYYQSFEDEWVEEHSLRRELMEQLVKLYDKQPPRA